MKIPGYHIYRKDRDSRVAWGGVAIIIKRRIAHNPLPITNITNLELIAVQIYQSNETPVNILSVYKQPKKILQEQDISEIFNNNNITLALGDFNCKNVLWGCRSPNPNGEKLNNMSARYAFQISAPNDNTYIPTQRNRKPDILDIVLHKNYNKSTNK